VKGPENRSLSDPYSEKCLVFAANLLLDLFSFWLTIFSVQRNCSVELDLEDEKSWNVVPGSVPLAVLADMQRFSIGASEIMPASVLSLDGPPTDATAERVRNNLK